MATRDDGEVQRLHNTVVWISWKGLRQVVFLGFAGAAFVLAVIGVLVPGIPTVPFLLLTSYFLINSSPALHARLLRSRLFGPILRDWRDHGGLRPKVKRRAYVFMAVMLALGIALGGVSGTGLLVVLLLSMIGVVSLARIPTIPTTTPP
ncbi:MAG: YbaN family protein [Planctomycetota bacterium]|nr:YbaN family protein [Planctomycetota bacterium]